MSNVLLALFLTFASLFVYQVIRTVWEIRTDSEVNRQFRAYYERIGLSGFVLMTLSFGRLPREIPDEEAIINGELDEQEGDR